MVLKSFVMWSGWCLTKFTTSTTQRYIHVYNILGQYSVHIVTSEYAFIYSSELPSADVSWPWVINCMCEEESLNTRLSVSMSVQGCCLSVERSGVGGGPHHAA